MVTVPRQRTAANAGRYGGRYGGRHRETYPSSPAVARLGLLRRAAIEYVSGAAFCAGFLTVAALTALAAIWLL